MAGRSRGDRAPDARLVVDPVACDGVGMCLRLAPDLVSPDDWGYPIVGTGPLARSEERQARRAVAGCPRKALLLVPVPAVTGSRP